MKNFADYSQCEKLLEFLPIETADMCYDGYALDNYGENPPRLRKVDGELDTPCWSLAALLKVIPKHIGKFNFLLMDMGVDDFSLWYDEVCGVVNTELPDIERKEAVDACVDFLVKLHELNIL